MPLWTSQVAFPELWHWIMLLQNIMSQCIRLLTFWITKLHQFILLDMGMEFCQTHHVVEWWPNMFCEVTYDHRILTRSSLNIRNLWTFVPNFKKIPCISKGILLVLSQDKEITDSWSLANWLVWFHKVRISVQTEIKVRGDQQQTLKGRMVHIERAET